MISIVVPTRNRHLKIKRCLESILTNSFVDFEILVVDQSSDFKTKKIIDTINSKKIKYYKSTTIGKAKALNYIMPRVKGNIIAFTDDDCIVNKDWLKQIFSSFLTHREIVGIVGTVWPYRPELHKGEISTAVSMNRKEHLVGPTFFKFEDLGLGNNMAFRKSIFQKVGYFKWWLGTGSISKGGIESEFIYRVINNNLILVNPKIQVFHDRWLSQIEEQKKQNHYSCGFTAFCFYYLFKGDLKIFSLLYSKLKRRVGKRLVVSIQKRSLRIILQTVLLMITEIPYYILGAGLGFYFCYFERFHNPRYH